MINVTDLYFKEIKRNRKVNGEDVIELIVFKNEYNENDFDLIVEEAVLEAFDNEYVIKKMNEKSLGEATIKQVTAIKKFYVDLINKQQPTIHTGSITFNNYMNLVFENTGITFEVIDSFKAREFENLGDDNRLALLSKGVDRFKAEFEHITKTKVRFKQQIGNDTDFQFRYGHNIKAISIDVDTKNLATKIEGTGDPELGIKASYTSPNVAIFGEIDAPPVRDERFKTNAALLDELKSRIIDEPEFTLTIDFVDLRAAGYPYTVPNEGDRVFVIYEPMNDLLIETRIMEIDEVFDVGMKPIKTEVTLSNHSKSFAGTMMDNVNKQLSDIVNDDGIIRYSVLDEAVKIATESLQSAQTELEFNNGIIAREKGDPNRLVLLNSKGLGISKDGGNTFIEAITADGFVLTAGAIGRLSANHIQIGPETEYESGYDPYINDDALRDDLRITSQLPTSILLNSDGITAYVPSPGNFRFARLDHRGLYISGGAIHIDGGLSDDKIENAGKWNQQGTYIDEHGVYTGKLVAGQLQGGVIRSLNDNTEFDLNNGRLFMKQSNFVLGSGAKIVFQDPNNSLIYTLGRTAGLGFGNSSGGKSFVFMGTTIANDFKAKDSSDFAGFVSNAATGGGGNEIVNTVAGKSFRVRNNIEDHNVGFTFDFYEYSDTSNNRGIFRPLNNSYTTMIGEFGRPFDFVYADEIFGELQGSSSRRLKSNIIDMPLNTSLEFVKNTKIVEFNWINPKKKGKRVGFILEDLEANVEHLIKVDDVSYRMNNIIFIHQHVLQYLLLKVQELEKGVA